jgi:hypothetical protein
MHGAGNHRMELGSEPVIDQIQRKEKKVLGRIRKAIIR